MDLSISYLEELQKKRQFPTHVHELMAIFLASMNDWPTEVLTLADYEKEIYALFKDEGISRSKLDEYGSKLDLRKQAWEAESLYQLLNVFNYYEDGKLLREIVHDIGAKIADGSKPR